MSSLEPPATVTRKSPLQSPELPPSPTPSHNPKHKPSPGPVPAHPRRLSSSLSSLGQCSVTDTSEPCGQTGYEEDEEPLRDTRQTTPRESWWREVLKEWKLMLTLENSGSVARDHLASERTFLAYTRTSLTIASSGVALVQLFTLSAEATDRALERFARPLGAALIIMGLCTLAMGAARYFVVQNALIRGVYPVARISTSLLAFVLLALILAVFTIVLAAR